VDLAIVDQRLGCDRGSDVIAKLIEIDAAITAVLTSADLRHEDAYSAGRLGVRYCAKPSDLGALIAGIEAGIEVSSGSDGVPTEELTLEAIERRHVDRVLQHTGNNITRAAALLGLSRFGLQQKLRKLGIEVRSGVRSAG
jgi:ActR/RegA family two-component response regulator